MPRNRSVKIPIKEVDMKIKEMTRQQILERIKKYFDLQELVCKHIYNKYGQSAWDFFDKDLLAVLLYIRETLDKAIYVNNWQLKDGNLTQRGLRCQQCQMVKDKTKDGKPYMSAHCLAKALDFDVKGMKAEDVRQWIVEHKKDLPHPIRLEDGVSWVHIDVRYDDEDKMVYKFKV